MQAFCSHLPNSSFALCHQVDVAFLRAARAGNLDKVRTFLTEEGDIHTCNAVSFNNLFTNGLKAVFVKQKEYIYDAAHHNIAATFVQSCSLNFDNFLTTF